MDTEDVSENMSCDAVDTDSTDIGEMPDEPGDMDSTDFEEVPEEPEKSIAELYQESQEQALAAQQEAEEWADEEGITEWSDGTPRDGMADLQEDEPEKSIAELYQEDQERALDAQQEAEEWADSVDANTWADGSMREGHEDDDYYRSTLDAYEMEQEGLRQQEEYNNRVK